MSVFEFFEKFMTCMTPLIVAWFGYISTKSQRETKKVLEMQAQLKDANAQIKKAEDDELTEHLKKIDASIASLVESVQKLSNVDKRITDLVELSNTNFEFCTSLSSVIISIGNALDSSDIIMTDGLSAELTAHKKKSVELIGRACKVAY